MRRLAFLVHPDRFPDAPDARDANAVSLSYLQGLLSTVQRARDVHPPAAVQRLTFHLREGDPQRIRVVQHVVRTTGGDCRAVVQRSLSELFSKCGLPAEFRWGTGDWQLLSKEELAERDNRGPNETADEPAGATKGLSEAERPAAQPAAFDAEAVARQRQPHGDARGLADALKRLSPMFEALAAVPWLPLTPAGAERRHYLTHHVLGTLATDGWRIERGVTRIWRGERDADALVRDELLKGTDAASAEALKAVLSFTLQLEAELGPPGHAATTAAQQ